MEHDVLRANYLLHEQIYAAKPTASGWNEPAVDREILSYVEELLSHAQVVAPATLLEVGCGMGNLAMPLAHAGFRVTGIDIAATAIARAVQKAQIAGLDARFRVGNVILPEAYRELPAFDCILDGLCWHCIIGQDRPAFLRCVRNALKPGGCFLVMTMCGNPRSPRLQALFDPVSRCITNGNLAARYLGMPQDVEAELRNAGFEIIYHRFVDGNSVSGDQDMFLAVTRSI
jgi:2-polyprenyl-3-methyl-5-hydroxy-6-metoxy-1,4-benzoquinol methylase